MKGIFQELSFEGMNKWNFKKVWIHKRVEHMGSIKCQNNASTCARLMAFALMGILRTFFSKATVSLRRRHVHINKLVRYILELRCVTVIITVRIHC